VLPASLRSTWATKEDPVKKQIKGKQEGGGEGGRERREKRREKRQKGDRREEKGERKDKREGERETEHRGKERREKKGGEKREGGEGRDRQRKEESPSEDDNGAGQVRGLMRISLSKAWSPRPLRPTRLSGRPGSGLRAPSSVLVSPRGPGSCLGGRSM
jgi:hypothetical protein